MTDRGPLSRSSIAISISESPDMEVLGLAKEHLDDAMAEIARYLLALGAELLYGGALRYGGYTDILLELVDRHARETGVEEERPRVTNFLAWPVHVSLPFEEVRRIADSLRGTARLACLTLRGDLMSPEARQRLVPRPAAAQEWARGLTAMRETMAGRSHARVVLGGRTDNFQGRMPGVAEEALISLRTGQPLYLLGGFGGCVRDIATDLALANKQDAAGVRWRGRNEFAGFTPASLRNGLNEAENQILATTVHVDQAVALLLRGLLQQTPLARV